MRIRQIKPAFWSDKVMAHLPKSTRLAYIGLWMLADDAGWIVRFDCEQASAELYPFEPVHRRERDMGIEVARLKDAERVRGYDCGCLEVPHLPEHQRIAGRQNFTARDAHRRHLNGSVATGSYAEPTGAPVGNGRVGNGTERGGVGGTAKEASDFDAEMAAAGLRR